MVDDPQVDDWERAAELSDMPVELIRRLTEGGRGRALAALDEARRLNAAGFHGPAYVWAVRAAEVFMRDFVLAPGFMLEGLPWRKAWAKGSKILGPSNWSRAFAKADEWYGPFDEPLTTDNRNAWKAWTTGAIIARGQVVHGHAIHPPTADEAAGAIAFVDRLISWWTQRLITSDRHPAGQEFREAFDAAREALHGGDTDESWGPQTPDRPASSRVDDGGLRGEACPQAVEDAHQEIREEHDLAGLGGIVVVDLPMAGWIFEGADRSGEQLHHPHLLAGVEPSIGKRAAIGLERLAHQLDANQRVVRAGELSDTNLDLAHRGEGGELVLAEQELCSCLR
jgi:hypothetical protein